MTMIEPPLAPLLPDLADEPPRRGRVRNRLSSFSQMPGIFSYTVAVLVVQKIARGPWPGRGLAA